MLSNPLPLLQGLKVKHVRQLCYDQLNSMTDDQIIRAITNSAEPEPSSSSLRGSESEIKQEPDKVEAKEEMVMEVGVSGGASGGKWKDAGGDVRSSCAEEKNTGMLEEAVQMVLDVSDVSDGEASAAHTLLAEPEDDSSKKKLEVPMSEGTSRKEDRGGGGHSGEEGGGSERREECCDDDGGGGGAMVDVRIEVEPDKVEHPNLMIEVGKDKSEKQGASITSEEKKNNVNLRLCGTTEAAELLEMKLRRRALESELRRSNRKKANECREKEAQQEQQAWNRSDKEVAASQALTTNILRDQIAVQDQDETTEQPLCEDFISVHPQYEANEEEEDMGGGGTAEEGGERVDIGELLEERLRRRALQSMLAKRKATSTT